MKCKRSRETRRNSINDTVCSVFRGWPGWRHCSWSINMPHPWGNFIIINDLEVQFPLGTPYWLPWSFRYSSREKTSEFNTDYMYWRLHSELWKLYLSVVWLQMVANSSPSRRVVIIYKKSKSVEIIVIIYLLLVAFWMKIWVQLGMRHSVFLT